MLSTVSSVTTIVLAAVILGVLVGTFAPQFVSWIELQFALRRVQGRLRRSSAPLGVDLENAVPRQPDMPPGLAAAVAEGQCVLFAGAELSAQAGVPSGDELLTTMIDELERLRPADDWAVLREQIGMGQTALVAEIMRRRLGPDGVRDMLADLLKGSRGRRSTLLNALGKVSFAGVVTDQWDHVVTTAFRHREPIELTPRRSRRARDVLRGRRFFVLKLYGDVSDPEDLLFTIEDYREALHEERDYALFITALLTSRTVLFLGSSVGDIEAFLSASGGHSSRLGAAGHTAMVPYTPGFSLHCERMQERYGLTLLSYDASAGTVALEVFIEALQREASRLRRRSGSTLKPLRLKGLTLENIGPFEHLDIEFEQEWTVLLGDNASGKSTILRAVALAICGESPETLHAPSRLLRSEASFGSITLGVGQGIYRTELRREGERVRVDAVRPAPVQDGTWLALGFPPLRGISTKNPQGATAVLAKAPSQSDLMPLLNGEIDIRLNDVKQWVFTTWLLARDGSADRRGNHAAVLETFFDLLRRLTPGISFGFRGVDDATGEILLDSPDGTVTIDMLSQGISSMLAWIGVLLERLYEVYERTMQTLVCVGPSCSSTRSTRICTLTGSVDCYRSSVRYSRGCSYWPRPTHL
ncbi:MAG TPA: AAA family ATPase [Solirubrobacteraceae bacterium]|nr:AAA family ATPase [Solirubrobacteraceae bacterium]